MLDARALAEETVSAESARAQAWLTDWQARSVFASMPMLLIAAAFVFAKTGRDALSTVALHSLVVVMPLVVVSYLVWRRATPLVVGMLSHGVVDLLTHRTSAYNHLFPIPMAPMASPLDYRDPGFAVVEHLALLAFVFWVASRWRRASGSGQDVHESRT